MNDVADSTSDRSWARLLRTPTGMALIGAVVLAGASHFIFGGWHWVPIPLAVITVGLLADCVSGARPSVSVRMSVVTVASIVALLAAVTMTTDDLSGKPGTADSTVDVALGPAATTTPEAAVEAATLDRDSWERLVACESALEQIRVAISSTPGFVAPEAVAAAGSAAGSATGASEAEEYSELRLRSCEVRLSAIASSLQP